MRRRLGRLRYALNLGPSDSWSGGSLVGALCFAFLDFWGAGCLSWASSSEGSSSLARFLAARITWSCVVSCFWNSAR